MKLSSEKSQKAGEKYKVRHMTKQYLGKNINLFLIVMLIVSITGIVVMSNYYTQRYEHISAEYRETATELESESRQLIATRNELLQLRSTLNETTTDIQRYDELYLEKVDELNATARQLVEAQDNYDKTRRDLIETTNRLQDEQSKTSNLQGELNQVESDLALCETSLRRCRDELDYCEGN